MVIRSMHPTGRKTHRRRRTTLFQITITTTTIIVSPSRTSSCRRRPCPRLLPTQVLHLTPIIPLPPIRDMHPTVLEPHPSSPPLRIPSRTRAVARPQTPRPSRTGARGASGREARRAEARGEQREEVSGDDADEQDADGGETDADEAACELDFGPDGYGDVVPCRVDGGCFEGEEGV